MNLGNLFGNSENKKIAEDMQNLSNQIATLQSQLSEKNTTVDSLQQQLTAAESSAAVSTDSKKQIQDLQSQIAVAQADKEAHDIQMKDLMDQVSQMQAQLAVAEAATANAPQGAATLSTGGLSIGSTAWVTRDGGMQLNVRSGPSLGHGVIAALDQGSSMTLLAGPENADGHPWYQIRSDSGVEGWVAGDNLRDHEV